MLMIKQYHIVSSRSMCYYSENNNFCFLKSQILTCRIFFLGKKLFCLPLDLLDHGLRTPNEDIIQRYLKNWADVADKICFGHT